VPRLLDIRRCLIRKNIRPHQIRQRLIKMRHIGESAAQHDAIRVEQIGDHRQRPGEALGVAVQRGAGLRVPGGGAGGQGAGIGMARPVAIARQGRPRQIKFEAAPLPAPAAGQRQILRRRPGQGGMAEFPRQAVPPLQHAAIHHDARPGAGAENDAEDDVRPRGRAIHGLGEGEAIGIIRHAHLAPQQGGEVAVESLTVERIGAGVLHQPGRGGDAAGYPHPHRGPAAGFLLRLGHHRRDAAQRRLITGGGGPPPPQKGRASRVQNDDFRFRAAEIDADAPCHGRFLGRNGVLLKRSVMGIIAPWLNV